MTNNLKIGGAIGAVAVLGLVLLGGSDKEPQQVVPIIETQEAEVLPVKEDVGREV